MNIMDYFEKVRIINMVSRTDRRKETEQEFARHKFEINTHKVSFFDAITPDEPKGFPNKGARGCFLSHLSILENSLKSNSRNLLILEDDICFSKHISEFGKQCIKDLSNMDWDIVYFGHTFENSPGPIQWLPLEKPTQLSHFYALNGSAIKRLAECLELMLLRPGGHPEGGPMHYDGALNTFIKQNTDLKIFYISTDLGYQRPSKTNIHEHSFLDSNPVVQPIMTLLRLIKQTYYRAIR